MGCLLFVRIVFDCCVLAIIALSDTYINFYLSPFERGYFLDDESIQYPYKEGNTVDFNLIVILGSVVPTLVIILVEVCLYHLTEHSQREPPISLISTCHIPDFLVASYQYVGMLWIGLASTEISTEIPKLLVGRLRPHFLAVCQPDTSQLNTTLGYIETDICSGTDTYAIDEARRSFPSSHSAMAMFPAAYLALYLSYRLRPWSILRMPVFLIACVLINLALCVGCTRVSDYKHHWSDVVAGLALGAFVAIVLIYLNGGKKLTAKKSSGERSLDSNIQIDNPMFMRQEINASEPF